jgi:hypothetical protein
MASDPSAHRVMAVLDTAIHALLFKTWHRRYYRLSQQATHYKKPNFSLWITSEFSISNKEL